MADVKLANLKDKPTEVLADPIEPTQNGDGTLSFDMSGGNNIQRGGLLGDVAEKTIQSMNQPSINFADQNYGLGIAMQALDKARSYGAQRLTSQRMQEDMRTYTDKYANGTPADELPLGPGYTYMSHLFNRHKVADRIESYKKNGASDGAKIFTEQMEAVKAALATMGIYSDKNPGGLPIDIKEAKKIWFGNEEIDEIKEAEWRQTIEIGDSKIDPKRIRKFVNYDGSLTWEILNQDKTVMSRFTLGDYNGTKIFAQGGYKNFAELLKKARGKIGPNLKGQFDAIRGMFGG